MVDAGCGTGALVSFLKEAGVKERDVTGVDVSPEVRFVLYATVPRGYTLALARFTQGEGRFFASYCCSIWMGFFWGGVLL